MKTSVVVAALLASGGAAHAACETPRLLSPGADSLTATQPRLAWTGVAAARGYRVRVLSRVPNGRVIATHDTVVNATEFLPPRPLAEQRAKVTVRLNALCGGETSAEGVSSFVIDTSPACALGDIEAAFEAGKAILKWPALPGARSYEVRAYRLLDGALLASRETRETALQIPLGEPAVLSVRPSCASGPGEAVYRAVAAR
jgi:hypothetical protein